jgi:hypothetical protein
MGGEKGEGERTRPKNFFDEFLRRETRSLTHQVAAHSEMSALVMFPIVFLREWKKSGIMIATSLKVPLHTN